MISIVGSLLIQITRSAAREPSSCQYRGRKEVTTGEGMCDFCNRNHVLHIQTYRRNSDGREWAFFNVVDCSSAEIVIGDRSINGHSKRRSSRPSLLSMLINKHRQYTTIYPKETEHVIGNSIQGSALSGISLKSHCPFVRQR